MKVLTLKSGKTLLEYPYSRKWVLLSCVLVAATITITLFGLTDRLSFLLFLVYTLILTTIFLVLKFYLYSTKTEEKLESLHVEEERRLRGENPLKRPIVALLIALIIGLSLPFCLLLFLSPFTWFLFLTGFIAGINIPEIILYVYAQRIRKSNE